MNRIGCAALIAMAGCQSMRRESSTLLVPQPTANYPEMHSAIVAFAKDGGDGSALKPWYDQQPRVTLKTAAVVARQQKDDGLMPAVFKTLVVTDPQRIETFAPLLGSPDLPTIAMAKANLEGVPSEAFVPYMIEMGRGGDVVDPIVAYLFSRSRVDGLRRAIEMNKGVDEERMIAVARLVDQIEAQASSEFGKSGDAKAGLETLSKEKEWWLRGYVLMVMKQSPRLADKAMIDRLETDKNDRVPRLQKPWVNHS